MICPKLLDIPKESRTFALLESATLPVEQRTRAELFLYIRLWIIQIPLLKFLL
ncbi:abortive infection bacteriophage resistance domain protein [Bacteroides uniformis str. 3978 T3 ii]|uniref:Abortive infection bacteriophage resistance domain protein n=1 Tax=Bacteroides uniformis str. 3978 T3 ii TaxID=1339349 RepID=A0A078S0Q0_BACUN|nr:abortive infection bacteriophage resistance domain protein [Bacteroides uniformis str. 3978 T3 ii]